MFTFLSLLPLALWMWAAHAGRRQPAVSLVVYLSMIGANVLLIVSGSLVLLASFASGRPLLALQNTALTPDDLAFLGRTLLLGGLAATLVMVPFIQRGLARFMDIRPKDPVHTTALVMACYFVTSTLVQTPLLDLLTEEEFTLSPTELVGQAFGLTLLALAGTGLGITRSWQEAVQRLGLAWPRWSDWRAALIGTTALVVMQSALGAAWMAVAPESLERVNRITTTLLGEFFNPTGAIIIGLSAGISEELVFRGALQPRFGLLITSMLFASVHLQYAFSFALVIVFILALGLGYLRQRYNTTTAIIVHVLYNALLILLAITFPEHGA